MGFLVNNKSFETTQLKIYSAFGVFAFKLICWKMISSSRSCSGVRLMSWSKIACSLSLLSNYLFEKALSVIFRKNAEIHFLIFGQCGKRVRLFVVLCICTVPSAWGHAKRR
jgi:hypothetical protein